MEVGLNFAKFVGKKVKAWPLETTLKRTIWMESHCLAMPVKRHSGEESDWVITYVLVGQYTTMCWILKPNFVRYTSRSRSQLRKHNCSICWADSWYKGRLAWTQILNNFFAGPEVLWESTEFCNIRVLSECDQSIASINIAKIANAVTASLLIVR